MNDRFKFRVWNEQYGRYIQDNEYPIGGDYSLSMTQYGYVEVIGLGDYQEGSDTTHSWGRVKNLREYIGECIIEQCTGLKDKNGKLIYEGDIIEHRIYLGNPELYIVKWSESVNGWVYQDAKNSLKTSYILTEFTDSIIGNIHENQELLKESK